jgi:hypothetical protein
MSRDEFPPSVFMRLRERAAYFCSNPDCRRITVRPHSDPTKSVVTGEACHIHAASPLGPRYNPDQTPEQRSGIENAIWLCSACSDAVDKDVHRYPVEILKQWKSDHERWVSEEAMIPKLPNMQIKDLPGIPLPSDRAAKVTSEDCDKFRHRQLLLENSNRVSLFSLSFRIQLPETIVKILKAECPPGVHGRFQPEDIPMIASAQGEGASVTQFGPQRPTTNWTLELDSLPARAAVRISILTAVDWMHADTEGMPLFPEDQNVLEYYIDGQFLFEYRGERVPRQIVVPLRFESRSRVVESLPPQSDISPYTSICKTGRWG